MLHPRILKSPPLSVDVVTDEAGMHALRSAWETAAALAPRASLFCSFEYIHHAWRHFRGPGDQPYLMAVRCEDVLVGLLPLVLMRERRSGLPLRVLRTMGLWGGDRPGLLATIDTDLIWEVVFETLQQHRSDWDLLDLRELDQTAWPVRHADCLDQGLRTRLKHDTEAAFLPIEGQWKGYLASRSRNTRQSYSRRARQLREACPDLRIEVARHPLDIAWAFERYLALEQRSRTYGAEGTAGCSRRSRAFYRELLPALAERRQAEVWLLYGSGQDIAGLIRLRHRDLVYERHATFDPQWARYSPGTFLCMQAVRMSFGHAVRESDVLGLHRPLSERPSIGAWYDGVRQTYRLTAWNLRSPMALVHLCAAILVAGVGVLSKPFRAVEPT
jgi:CelD/BcsL family acetyltransferase involved in cellulose biosynthesis